MLLTAILALTSLLPYQPESSFSGPLRALHAKAVWGFRFDKNLLRNYSVGMIF